MKIDKDNVTLLKEAFAFGADVTSACAFADISRKTYYQWCKENPAFEDKCNKLRETTVLKAFNTINENLKDVNTAKWYIEKKRKKEFGNSLDITSENEKITGFNFIKNEKDIKN